MPSASRTLGPLHFEDLDPKRFEDLVRQLIYDFRPWRSLEATGRAGSDDGFDVRGYESQRREANVTEDGQLVDEVSSTKSRLWLVQCKRERAISPKKLLGYLEEIKLMEGEVLHGLIFAAACDFSKRSRDEFARACREKGLEEWHLWGKAELEDQLLRPTNDHLLFAYFGISLGVRRRTQVTRVRAVLTAKRKAERALGERIHRPVLIRAIENREYPYKEAVAGFANGPPWMVFNYLGTSHAGLLFEISRHFAFLDDDGVAWDAALAYNDGLHFDDDPWADERVIGPRRNDIWEEWNKLPELNRAWMTITGVLPYDSLVDIDGEGDEVAQMPHLYVDFAPKDGPFSGTRAEVATIGARGTQQRSFFPDGPEHARTQVFAEALRSGVRHTKSGAKAQSR